MRDGFLKIAAGTPQIRVADCRFNAESCFTLMREACLQGVRVLVLPELCLTGATCGDLFLQETLLRGAQEALGTVLEATKSLDMVTALGLPLRYGNRLYDCAAVVHQGKLLGVVPKRHIPAHQMRWFAEGDVDTCAYPALPGCTVPFTAAQLFRCHSMQGLVIGVEIGEDLDAVSPPSGHLAALGATLILNPAAEHEIVGRSAYRLNQISAQSARLAWA